MSALLENSVRESDLEKFARDYADMVYAAAMRQMNGDDNAAADVTQAVMLVMLQKSRSGGLPEERFMAGWLLKITHYTVLQSRRSAARRARHEADVAKSMQPSACPSYIDSEVRTALDAAVLSLGRLDRELIVRRYLQGLSIGEAAAMVDMIENSAGRRIARAMDKLRKILAGRGITAPVSVLTAVFGGEVAVKAPLAAASTLVGERLTAEIAKKVLMKLAMAKLVMIALIGSVLSILVVGLFAVALPSTAPSSAPPNPTPQPRLLNVEVASVVAGPSDALLHQILVGLLENQKKFRTIHIAAKAMYCMYDQQKTAWMAPLTEQGEVWAEAGAPRRVRVQLERGQRMVVQDGKTTPAQVESYVEAWDGTASYRMYGPPWSRASGQCFDTRSLNAESLLGRDFSMQLSWDQESAADAQGSHKTIDRYSLDPAVLAQMKLSAREVRLTGGRDAMELELKTPDEEGMQHSETFWFDAARGYGLLARLDTIMLNGRLIMRTTSLIDSVTEASPGIFYPSAGEKSLEMQGRPIYWEHFETTSMVTNEPIPDASFHIEFPRGMTVYDFIGARGTKRDWNSWPPVP